MKSIWAVLALFTVHWMDHCNAGVIRLEMNGDPANAKKLWVINFVKTPKVWFKGILKY